MKKVAAVVLGAAFVLAACASTPESNQIAQSDMVGLSEHAVLACMGKPAERVHPADRTEVWTYPSGMTSVSSPPWAFGSDFSQLKLSEPCNVQVVMTNGRVSQVSYSLPDGRSLPSGRQCTFAAATCASLRGTQ
jgi:hypothetical protein